MNDLSDMLIKHRLIHEQAINDPQGFDGGETKASVNCIQEILTERERNYKAEIERLEAAQAANVSIINALTKERTELQAALAEKDKECQRLREAMQFIARYGGTVDEDENGLVCNGSWCAEQARAALAKEGV